MTSLQRLPLFSIGLLSAILLLVSIQLHSQTQNGARRTVDNADYSSLMLVVDRNGFAKVNLWLPAKLDDPSRLQRALMQAVNFPMKFDEPPKAVSAEQADESLEEIGAASWTFIKGRSEQSLSNQGMKSTTRITLQPLKDELRAAGMKRLLIGIMFEDPDAEVVLAGGTKVGPANGNLSLNYFNSEVNLEAPKTAAIEFSFGYSGADISRRCIPLAAFILFAALLTLWQRRSALKLQEQLVEMWGRYFHFWQLLMSLIWLVWIPICAWTRLNNVISFEIGRDRRLTVETLNIALYLLPPLFTLCLCHLLSKPVYDRVSGVEWSPRDVMKRAIATNAVSLLPLFIILIVLGMFTLGSRFTGVFLILAGVAWLLSLGLVNRVFRFSVYAVSAGEFRNRIFEMAHKAGVAVKQVYVLPESSSQLSNAFARSDNAVMITASLLKNLSKREVDAIMAHEIGHLKEKHPQIRGHITLGAIIVTNLVASSLSSVINLPRSAAVIFSFAMLASMLILHFVSRSNERHADAIAIGLTADPESFISGLSRLSRLNLMPLNSGSWGQSLETHPRTMNRLQDIARVHGVSEQRFHELLHDPAAEDRYSTAGVESGKAFSTDFKKKRTTRVALAMMALLWFFPALLTLLLARMNLQGLAQWMVYFAGAIITFLLYLIEKNFVTALGFRRPAHALRKKLAQQGFVDAARQGA